MQSKADLQSLIVAAALMGSSQVSAHHAFAANFDAERPIRFEAVITKMEWINPHAWMTVEVTRDDGTVEEWMIEAGSPNMLFRRGINQNTVQPGMRVIVDGYQARNGARRANGRDITLPDGTKLFLSGASDLPEAPE
ncbi:MAG TPA: DUF6152 family protein [Gammaproteobacteria bacterium]